MAVSNISAVQVGVAGRNTEEVRSAVEVKALATVPKERRVACGASVTLPRIGAGVVYGLRVLFTLPCMALGMGVGAALGAVHGLFYDHFFDHEHGDVVAYFPVSRQDDVPHPISAVAGIFSGALIGAAALLLGLWGEPKEGGELFLSGMQWHTHSHRNGCGQ